MHPLRKNTLLLSVLWTGLLLVLFFLNFREIEKGPVAQAQVQARSLLSSVISFRSWASHFGGVYVTPTEQYPPNPYLKTPERDLVTRDGKALTLINPAYMTRQVLQDFYSQEGINGHISSLHPLNPQNTADTWEKQSLLAFEQGSTHAWTVEPTQEGSRVLRYMQPLYVENKCLKCHGDQGYRIGDVQGGISTNIDLSHGDAIAAGSIQSLLGTYVLVWLIGLGGIFVLLRRSMSLAAERKQKDNLLAVSENLAQGFINGLSEVANLEDSLHALASMLEKRDPYTAGHQLRVADLAEKIALELGMTQDQAHGVRLAGMVHDIGKIQIPAEVLNKPGKLSDLEHSMIRLHPQVGFDILKAIRSPWPIPEAVRQHHERLDGSGYPQGLKANDIIMEARILAVADTVEAMSSHRPYRPGLGLEAALAEIKELSGTQLDPVIVEACLRIFHEKDYRFSA